MHTYCDLPVNIAGSCATVFKQLKGTIDQFSTLTDPAGGVIEMVQTFDNHSVWVTRTSPKEHYVDDVMFEVVGDVTGDPAKCRVQFTSRSQMMSYYDKNVNFCNLFNVFQSTKYEILDNSKCKWQPTSDPITKCKVSVN